MLFSQKHLCTIFTVDFKLCYITLYVKHLKTKPGWRAMKHSETGVLHNFMSLEWKV